MSIDSLRAQICLFLLKHENIPKKSFATQTRVFVRYFFMHLSEMLPFQMYRNVFCVVQWIDVIRNLNALGVFL